ncbi:ribosome hibernation-promoting factor, HPF/YfiA family [Mycoplasmoides alvi]|uniref:ribosome hibernation-promoting factor, HPF/YfiA family n=1 Tax=Mycoplasmoides alvi TaxID=78580 RepID=UPI00051B16F4|nr:ribosome-associated translation inhibitor RaiA [Mycoplasmoides alvi]
MFSIRWKEAHPSPAVRSYFESKLNKIYRFKDVDQGYTKAEIEYFKHEDSFTVRLNISILGSHKIHSEDHNSDVLTAINKVVEKTLDQIRRLRTKREK